MRLFARSAFIVALLALGVSLLSAQTAPDLWPGAKYDPAIPSFQKILGYEPGERIAPHADIMRYFEALAASQPARLQVFEYARSWQERKLIYAVLSSEANMRRLDEIRAGMQKLADPRRTSAAVARPLIASLPAVVWLAYGVHGNEISSPDAAMFLAYHLLASRGDRMVDEILEKTIILIDPTQNPDGRDRFVNHFNQSLGLEPDPTPVAVEHTEPWPNGRTNHYHFDLNRDWFALTQPETRGRVKVLQQWFPLVFVDLHEMGSDSTYYFAPEADPYNPHLVKAQRESLHWFGRNNAKWFDQFGYDYFTREVYDAFYPGYGASWPSYYGAIAMTYENASSRGLLMRRYDTTVLSFRETVRKHFISSLSTAETASLNREKLLDQFYTYRRTAVEEGSTEKVREYILPRRGDTSAVDKLAAVLSEQGVELKRAGAAFRNGAREFPAGSYVISLAQPSKRLIRTLLDPDVAMDETFMKEQERRRRKNLSDEIYDVTAWSLPLIYNVEAVAVAEPSRGSFEPVRPDLVPPATVQGGRAEVAYVAPWGTAAAARLLAASLRQRLRVLSSEKSFTQNGRTYPSGSLIFKVKDNPPGLHETLQKLAASSGAEIVATQSSWVDDGVNFGSRYVRPIPAPTVAMAWDTPTGSNPAGHTRFVLERQFGYPVTPVRTQLLGQTDLARFHVLVLPDGFPGGYSQVLGPGGIARLKDWVAAGGTLIGVGGAVGFLADPKVGLLSVAQETRPREEAKKPEPPADGRVPGKLLTSEDEFQKAIQAETALPDRLLGVLLRARLDPDHWVTAGLGESVNVLASGRAIYTPIKLDKGVNAAFYDGPAKVAASGYLWEETRKQIAYKPFVMVQREGRGQVIAFTADPNFRAYMDGLNLLFLNAVFRGPAYSRPVGLGDNYE